MVRPKPDQPDRLHRPCINDTVGSGDDGPLASFLNVVNVGEHKIDGCIFISGYCHHFQADQACGCGSVVDLGKSSITSEIYKVGISCVSHLEHWPEWRRLDGGLDDGVSTSTRDDRRDLSKVVYEDPATAWDGTLHQVTQASTDSFKHFL